MPLVRFSNVTSDVAGTVPAKGAVAAIRWEGRRHSRRGHQTFRLANLEARKSELTLITQWDN